MSEVSKDHTEITQTDLSIVRREWQNGLNIRVLRRNRGRYAAILFSSNALYFPNSEDCAYDALVVCDRYEWTATIPPDARIVIFVRDVLKQWYLHGVSASVPDIPSLSKALKKYCAGLPIICCGVSAGGYAAIRVGAEIGASRVFAFSAQIDLTMLAANPSEAKKNPLVEQMILAGKQINATDAAQSLGNRLTYFVADACEPDRPHAEQLTAVGLPIVRFRSTKHEAPTSGSALAGLLELPISASTFLSRLSRVAPLSRTLLTIAGTVLFAVSSARSSVRRR